MIKHNLRNQCRICSSKNLKLILDLGLQPPANSLLEKNHKNKKEKKFPLRLFICKDCYLVQLLDIVKKESLFKQYLYMTGASQPSLNHFSQYAKDIFDKYLHKFQDPLIIEIGSNDGSLLNEFKKFNTKIIGIEPATNLAEIANKKNILTINSFFNQKLAKELAKNKSEIIVIANNVVGHIDDLDELILGVKLLIKNNGIFILEVPYLIDLIKNLEFDTIYHEHLSYFSITPIIQWLKKYNLHIFHIEKQKVHGGSIRVFICSAQFLKQRKSVQKFLKNELDYGINKMQLYENFSKNVINLKFELIKKIQNLKPKNIIFGYGAPAKGNVLLNFCEIDSKILDYIIDTTPLKQGKLSPGTHIPIFHPDKILNLGKNHVALLLAWNYKSDIIKKEKKFIKQGGKFLIPIPKPKII